MQQDDGLGTTLDARIMTSKRGDFIPNLFFLKCHYSLEMSSWSIFCFLARTDLSYENEESVEDVANNKKFSKNIERFKSPVNDSGVTMPLHIYINCCNCAT